MAGLLEVMVAGGPIVMILAVLSLVSLTVIAAKVLQLSGVLAGDTIREKALAHWSQGDKTAAMAELEPGKSAVDRLLHQAMTGLRSGLPRTLLDADLEWRGNAEIAILNKNIRFLELTAMVSPLMGLLGTVLGMIQSFQELALAEGAANASLLASGIWQALLTTAVGLVVAIPAAIAATLLAARVETVANRIEASIGRLYAIEDRLS
ncbi:MotA/TolQ/ExbB proton channel family protein [Meridianimarinicoccus aquatilis]|uniref:MotA/TolQ/ExbB proton channel family protein n=1 Tax=Meridianimarinicoccus aquatilis TaxID=2552766 RepID=A0A4R6AQ03_9RHOB|nr:MotA/TolQ/ExbB proton channel family protein [Fluviibacterium aquatile]QIE43491.1 MotA/TolQ/ExbB proton channel family protein [Rhodobacteraceae bacterium SC52]TDL85494.1 MotA/TolQ/ExbB proton channel family protein [Fluviibacterium aquatile]